MPLIHTLLAQTENGQFSNQPNVFVSWIIQDALRTKNVHDIQPQTIYARLMTMNFAGIHTSSFTTVNFLLDSLARPDIFEDVKSEVFRIYSQQNRTWTKAAVDELRFTDQVLRESMRLSGPIVRLIRQVKAEVGAELNGVVLPKGTKIAVDMHNMHHDDNIYEQAHTLNPRRGDHLTDKSILPAATKTSEIFLPFGHGRVCLPYYLHYLVID
jgi:cytochrome P450